MKYENNAPFVSYVTGNTWVATTINYKKRKQVMMLNLEGLERPSRAEGYFRGVTGSG